MIQAIEALNRLKTGNDRFLSNNCLHHSEDMQALRKELAGGQQPFAIILGCSDSRVPPELIFDQSLGDLFVVRVAGNLPASSVVGSIEFAVEQLGIRLIVVLGHSECGAVSAALADLESPLSGVSHHLRSILDRIQPVVEPFLPVDDSVDSSNRVSEAVKANVHASVAALKLQLPQLNQEIENRDLGIMGAHYSLEIGRVEFFE